MKACTKTQRALEKRIILTCWIQVYHGLSWFICPSVHSSGRCAPAHHTIKVTKCFAGKCIMLMAHGGPWCHGPSSSSQVAVIHPPSGEIPSRFRSRAQASKPRFQLLHSAIQCSWWVFAKRYRVHQYLSKICMFLLYQKSHSHTILRPSPVSPGGTSMLLDSKPDSPQPCKGLQVWWSHCGVDWGAFLSQTARAQLLTGRDRGL